MQEDIERRALAISVSAGRITTRTLAKALSAALRKIRQERQAAHAQKHEAEQRPHGKQSVKQLMSQDVNTNTIPLEGKARTFDRIARKYNVDYAFRKKGPGQYLLFFKAGQADAITDCFAEYVKKTMRKGRKAPMREQIREAAEMAREKPQERTQEREAAHDDR